MIIIAVCIGVLQCVEPQSTGNVHKYMKNMLYSAALEHASCKL